MKQHELVLRLSAYLWCLSIFKWLGFYHFLVCSFCTMSLVQTLKVFFIPFTFSVKIAASLSLLHNWMMNKITSTVFSVAWSTLQNSQLHQLTSTCEFFSQPWDEARKTKCCCCEHCNSNLYNHEIFKQNETILWYSPTSLTLLTPRSD